MLLYGICRTELLKFVNNFIFLCKARALDRFQYKLEGERSEPKIFVTIYFSSLHSVDHTFFLSFHEQTIFFPQGAEQTIYFPIFAEHFFFTKHSAPPPPPRNQMVGRLSLEYIFTLL